MRENPEGWAPPARMSALSWGHYGEWACELCPRLSVAENKHTLFWTGLSNAAITNIEVRTILFWKSKWRPQMAVIHVGHVYQIFYLVCLDSKENLNMQNSEHKGTRCDLHGTIRNKAYLLA